MLKIVMRFSKSFRKISKLNKHIPEKKPNLKELAVEVILCTAIIPCDSA
jgi:uncharacterized protein (UPF0216 family)